jgi:hypothetical protein
MTSILRQAGQKFNPNGTAMDSEQPIAHVETITPEIAGEMLESGYGVTNRSIMRAAVERYSRDMRDGKWFMTGEAIKFDRGGQLIDGQHRLYAVIQSGVTIETLVIRGVDQHAFAFMDSGQKRTTGQYLAMHGYTNSNSIAAAANALHVYRNVGSFKKYPGHYNPRKEDVLEMVVSQPEIERGSRIGTTASMRTLAATPATMAALYVLFSEVDAEDAEVFFNLLDSGAGLEEGDAILVLRNQLSRMKSETTRVDQNYVAALTIKAWNFWRVGTQVKQLKYRPGGANPEKFPVIQ